MLTSLFECAFKLAAVCIGNSTFTVHHVVCPRTDIFIAIDPTIGTLSEAFVMLPLTCISGCLVPGICTLTVLASFKIITNVFITRSKVGHPYSRTLATNVVAFIHITSSGSETSLAVHEVIHPCSYILSAIGISIGTLSRTNIILPLTFIARTIAPIIHTDAVFLVILPPTGISHTVCKSICTLPIALIIFPFSIIDVAIVVVHNTPSLAGVTIPKANVFIIVEIVISATTVLLILQPLPFIAFSI